VHEDDPVRCRLSSVSSSTDCQCSTSNVRTCGCLARFPGVLTGPDSHRSVAATRSCEHFCVSRECTGDALFYPAWAFAVPTMVLSIPQAVVESGIWSIIVYWVTVPAHVCSADTISTAVPALEAHNHDVPATCWLLTSIASAHVVCLLVSHDRLQG
jgi:hypothetical protein